VRAVQATDADLGGTEMEKALMAVFALNTSRADSPPGGKPKGQERDQGLAPCVGNADVLLITDGEVWDTARMISAAQRSGHRVFVIGVGTSPAEAVLRHLADATGGACEFATPGEALEAAAARMLQRMRQGVWAGLRVQWGSCTSGAVAPSWALPVQKRAFAGDTLLALAGFEGLEDAQALGLLREARLMAEGEDGQARELCRIASTAVAAGDDLPRIAAARRVAMWDARDASDGMTDAERGDEPAVDTSPAQQARALALQYKLITRHTHGVLVHKRAEEDKPEDEAHLHRVQSMLAAGWGNTGRVASHRLAAPVAHMRFGKDPFAGLMMRTGDNLSAPSVWRSARTQATGVLREAVDSIDIPAFLRKRPTVTEAVTEAAPLAQAATTLADMSGAVADHLAGGGAVQDLASLAQGFTPEPAMESALAMAIEELRELLSDEAAAWLMLALWVAQRPEPDGNPAMAAALAGPASQAGWSAEAFVLADDVLYVLLSGFSSQGGMTGTPGKQPGRRPTRKERLAAALSGTGG
jgi:Ca-activated chloride channel family protein